MTQSRMEGSDMKPPAPGAGRKRPISFASPVGKTERGADLGATLNVLWRRRAIIAGFVVLLTAVSAVVVFEIRQRYSGEAAVILEPRTTQVVDVEAVLSGLPADSAVVRSEAEVLRSPMLAEQVAKNTGLAAVPEFNPRLQKRTELDMLLSPLRWLVAQAGQLLGLAPDTPEVPADPARADLLRAARRLLDRTEIANDGRSFVLKIRVESEDPALAAKLANAYADAYLDAQLEAKFQAVQRANAWLNQHLTALREKAEASDGAVQSFRSLHGLVLAKGETVNAQQVAELNSQLILAGADRAQKESNLKQLQDQIRAGGVSAAAQVLASPLIQHMREQQSELATKEADLEARYKPAHPAIVNIKAQQRDLENKIQEEIGKIAHGMAGEVEAARVKEASLRGSLASLQNAAARQGEADVGLHQLEREAEANRALYQNFLNRFKETSAQEGIQQPDARVIAYSTVPNIPSFPKRAPLIGAAFVGSLILGVFAAFGVERLDNGFHTGEQFAQITGIPILGLTPDLGSSGVPHDAVVTRPVSPYAEAIRSIRTALRYSSNADPPKIVAVTSALPDEGKTVFSLSLARSVAFSGGRALLIDCDLRRPSVAKLLKADPKPGLLALFGESVDRRRVVKVDDVSGMHYIPALSGMTNPPDLLGSKRMASLLETLREQYDLIVLDTPPTLAVSDSLVLSHAVDATIFLVRWARTPRPVVLGALKTFDMIGGRVAGAVLTRVDLRRHAAYGYGDPGYYYGYYRKYHDSYGKS
jgi:succinoglycan biosynthesis transport protein ExoP